MRGLIVCNGSEKQLSLIKRIADTCQLVVCADGGAAYAYKAGVVPNAIIGDLDSIDRSIKEYFKSQGILFLQYPKDKDETDTYLAINYCIEQGCDDITLCAALGKRFDHAFANVSLLAMLEQQGIKSRIIDGKSTVYVGRSQLNIDGKPGDILSLLPIGDGITVLETRGLAYAVVDRTFPFGYPFGVSNVFTQSSASVRWSGGWLMLVHTSV